ncbi:MAG: PEP-CTERM sorting domain-containing protein [Rhizomicrobium sp.]
MTVSLSQNLFIHEGNFATSNYGQFTGSITANGSIDLELQTTGSGTGFVQILASSLSSKDYAGEDGSEIGFNLAGSANSCEGGYPDACNFPPFPETPYPMGSVFSFTMSESSYAYTDPDHNPLSSVDGTTTFQFVFTDANGNPVNIAEVPEPGTMEFALIGALLAGLLTFARKRRKTNIAGF